MVVLISECGCSPVWSCHRDNPVEEGGGDPEGEIYSTLLNVTRYHYLLSVSLSSHLLHFCPVQTGHSNCWRRGVEGRKGWGQQKKACVWFAVQVHPLPTPSVCALMWKVSSLMKHWWSSTTQTPFKCITHLFFWYGGIFIHSKTWLLCDYFK